MRKAAHSQGRGGGGEGFLCFALAFCALVQVVLWRLHHPTQVEEAALDTFDLVYDRALRTTSGAWQRELAAIQDAFLCCGKRSPFSFLERTGANHCHGAGAPREDCLEGIRSFLRTQQKVDLALLSTALALTVHALLLSSFLWFAIRTCRGLHRRGKYALTPRQPPPESVLPLQSRR